MFLLLLLSLCARAQEVTAGACADGECPYVAMLQSDLSITAEADYGGLADTMYVPLEPPLPGVMPGLKRPHIVLAQDVNWPPYAFFNAGVAGTTGGLDGFGRDIALGMGALCNMDIEVVQTPWSKCWDGMQTNAGDNGGVGIGLLEGHFHGCMTYTHAQGVRNRFLEFSEGVVKPNKPAGLLVLLNADGTPKVDGNSDLTGLKVVDVAGWAPTADGLMYVTNHCTKQKYTSTEGPQNYTLLSADGDTDGDGVADIEPNDHAMLMLRSGAADAIFLYADQPYNYECNEAGTNALHSDALASWNCTAWNGFGKDYAFVQTGQFGHALNGTTIAISKKGSGLKQILDPCLRQFMKTKPYYDACVKAGFENACIENEFFPVAEKMAKKPYMTPTDELTGDCSTGYCPCPGSQA